MTLVYQADPSIVQLKETPGEGGKDTEFDIQLLVNHPYAEALKAIQHDFESNKVHTDVSFYAYKDHHYRVIVRNDYYVDFILALMKHRLVKQAEWK